MKTSSIFTSAIQYRVAQNLQIMKVQEINKQRNQKGIFSISNDIAGWYAISRDGVNMITFYQGKFTFSAKGDVNRFYTEKSFSKKITQLLNRGY